MKHPDSARTRREYVLNQMVDNGFILEALATKTGLLGLELRTHFDSQRGQSALRR